MSKPTCINLREWFGKRFKIEHEESYYAERPEYRAAEEVWLQIIPCEHGHICPWGGENLAACTNTAGRIAKRLKALPYARVAQDGDDGANVVFHVDHFEEVAVIMRPRRQRVGRQLSEAERAQLVAAGAKYRFTTGHNGAPDERQRVPRPPDDQKAVQPILRQETASHAGLTAVVAAGATADV